MGDGECLVTWLVMGLLKQTDGAGLWAGIFSTESVLGGCLIGLCGAGDRLAATSFGRVGAHNGLGKQHLAARPLAWACLLPLSLFAHLPLTLVSG